MAIALLQNSTAWSTNNYASAWPSNTTAGNLLVAYIDTGGATLSPPTGWQQAKLAGDAAIYYYPNCPGSYNLNNWPNLSGTNGMFFAEFSGVATSSPIDTTGGNSGTAVASIVATTSGNVSASGELAVGVVAEHDSKSGTSATLSDSFTLISQNGGVGNSNKELASYKLNPTSGTTLSDTGTTTTSSMNVNSLDLVIAVFKPATGGGGGGPTIEQLMMLGVG